MYSHPRLFFQVPRFVSTVFSRRLMCGCWLAFSSLTSEPLHLQYPLLISSPKKNKLCLTGVYLFASFLWFPPMFHSTVAGVATMDRHMVFLFFWEQTCVSLPTVSFFPSHFDDPFTASLGEKSNRVGIRQGEC